jgi:hypothetical protein
VSNTLLRIPDNECSQFIAHGFIRLYRPYIKDVAVLSGNQEHPPDSLLFSFQLLELQELHDKRYSGSALFLSWNSDKKNGTGCLENPSFVVACSLLKEL